MDQMGSSLSHSITLIYLQLAVVICMMQLQESFPYGDGDGGGLFDTALKYSYS